MQKLKRIKAFSDLLVLAFLSSNSFVFQNRFGFFFLLIFCSFLNVMAPHFRNINIITVIKVSYKHFSGQYYKTMFVLKKA
jgi:hypothetical protein